MKCQLTKPSYPDLIHFIERKSREGYNYEAVHGTRSSPVPDYDNDYRSIVLGRGESTWRTAKKVLKSWNQFPSPWTDIEPKAPLEEGQVVAVLFRIFGLWWINTARIVYTLDDDTNYGFAYGTLPGHVEKGEECFWIERDEEGLVSYHIRAFSKPAHWLVWLSYPVARYYQKQFVKQSLACMKQRCNDEI